MSTMRVLNVVGCRPNFMKVAPLVAAMRRHGGFTPIVVHTGQHRGEAMSDVFFRDLELPEPDIHMGVQPGSQARQIAEIIQRFEGVLHDTAPDLVVVVGDVSSTLACAITANKTGVPVAHVEAGLRSFDRAMPEEINRVLTDQVADMLFVSERSGVANLRQEGVPDDRIFFAGNVMIDTLLQSAPKLAASDVGRRLALEDTRYAVLTLHRPANVDDPDAFAGLVVALEQIQQRIRIVFPIHPRTAQKLELFGLGRRLLGLPNMQTVAPLGYVDFVRLMQDSALVLTDSGGIQEETTILRVPCLTLRHNTERPATITHGTNRLVGTDPTRVVAAAREAIDGPRPSDRRPELWDGHAAERIVHALDRERQRIGDLYRNVREQALCRATSTVA
jgi:UDP-N-acetylglucosamine 2-epimerase (non-hydrolysing)